MSCRVVFRISLLVIYVSFNGLITSVGEERANFSAVVNLYNCGFCSEGFPLPLGGLGWAALFYCGTLWVIHTIIQSSCNLISRPG